ncbi:MULTISPECIES: hypothetical protein [unclassified Streptomyces]|uniref:hypothetical protein n=1 Tax=unclassified Streptomyces TaxID=2593676 RepID=UPI0022AF2942|nr:hypothetical protein [Streptomyces sp. H39-C1]
MVARQAARQAVIVVVSGRSVLRAVGKEAINTLDGYYGDRVTDHQEPQPAPDLHKDKAFPGQ